MTLECSPTANLATGESFGLYKTPPPASTNNHLVLDLRSLTSTLKKVCWMIGHSKPLLQQMQRAVKRRSTHQSNPNVLGVLLVEEGTGYIHAVLAVISLKDRNLLSTGPAGTEPSRRMVKKGKLTCKPLQLTRALVSGHLSQVNMRLQNHLLHRSMDLQ